MALDPNEQPNHSIAKFESMLKTDDVYFFDAEDFEEIIHHYLNHGKVSLAKKAIQLGLQQHPQALELRLLEVEVLVFENQLQRAEATLNELQQIDSRNQEIYIQRANICSKQDNHASAIDWLTQALDLGDNDFDVYSLLGMEYLFLDDYEQAQRCFMRCLDADPNDYASLYNVVYCFEFMEDFEGAIRYLNTYLESNPYCQVAWHQLGKQYVSVSMMEEALAAFEFAIIADDTFIGAYFEKAKVLEEMGRYQEAIENYSATMELEDPTSHAYLRIGRCYENLGEDEKARYHYYLTVHEDPLLDKGWLAITDYYLRKEEFIKARDYINKAINIDGENAIYWKRCARIHQVLRQLDEADFAYKQAVDLGNYDLETWLFWAEVLRDNKESEAALEVLRQGKEFHPEEARICYQLAGICEELGRRTEAEGYLKYAVRLNPEQLEVFHNGFPKCRQASWARKIIKSGGRASE